jgi:hypothetical protein
LIDRAQSISFFAELLPTLRDELERVTRVWRDGASDQACAIARAHLDLEH